MVDASVPATRVCKQCGVEKPLVDFPVKKSGSTGLLYHQHRCRQCDKDCQRARNQGYYDRNRDRLLADMRGWRAANPSYESARWPRRRASASQYNKQRWAELSDEQRTERRDKLREWHRHNPDKSRAIELRRLERIRQSDELRAQAAARQRKWARENPEAAAASRDRRRAAMAEVGGAYSRDDVRTLLKVYGRTCFYCGDFLTKFTVDHFIPLSRGGSNYPSNLRLACEHCNYSKGAKMPWEWKPNTFDPPI